MWYLTIAILMIIALYIGYRFTLFVDKRLSKIEEAEKAQKTKSKTTATVKKTAAKK